MRSLVGIILILAALIAPVDAAIVEVGTSSSCDTADANSTTTLTCAHDAGSGPNRVTVVGVAQRGTVAPSVATYGGEALTAAHSEDSGTTAGCDLYYLLNPPSGSNNVQIDFATGKRYVIGAVTYAGVASVGNNAGATSADASTSPATVNITSAIGHLVVDLVSNRPNTSTLTVDGSQTQQWQDTTTEVTDDDNVKGAMSEEAGAATVTMSWDIVAARRWSICALDLIPAAAATRRSTMIFFP